MRWVILAALLAGCDGSGMGIQSSDMLTDRQQQAALAEVWCARAVPCGFQPAATCVPDMAEGWCKDDGPGACDAPWSHRGYVDELAKGCGALLDTMACAAVLKGLPDTRDCHPYAPPPGPIVQPAP